MEEEQLQLLSHAYQNGAINEDVFLYFTEQINLEEVKAIFFDGSLLTEDELEDFFFWISFPDMWRASKNLKSFEIYNAPVYGLLTPEAYPKLEQMIVNHTSLSSIIFAKSAPNLRVFSAVDNDLEAKLVLSADMPLEELNVSNNPKLESVDFDQRETVKVARLRQLPKFKASHLQLFTNLEELHIDIFNNKHSNFLPQNLTKLHLSVKRGTEFKQLPPMEKLEELSITRSERLKVIKLPELPSLKTLNISYNSLIKLPDLGSYTKLEEVCVKGNALLSREPLNELRERGVRVVV